MTQKEFAIWKEYVWSPHKILILMEVGESVSICFLKFIKWYNSILYPSLYVC